MIGLFKCPSMVFATMFFVLVGFGCQSSHNRTSSEESPEYEEIPDIPDNNPLPDPDDDDSTGNTDDDDSADGTGGAGALTLPFPEGEHWTMTRGYNTGSHIDYGYDWVDDRYALDFTLPGCQSWRKPIRPIRSGTVELAGYSSTGYGHYVLLNHGDGYKSRYGHFDETLVEVGEFVTPETVIGLTGNSGNVIGTACPEHPGTHLHLAYYRYGEGIRPEPMSGHVNFTAGCRYGHHGWIDCNGDGVPDGPVGIPGDDDDDDSTEPPTPGDDDDDSTEPPPEDPCDWIVPTEVATIQSALNLVGSSGTNGQTICVEPGSYSGDLVFPNVDLSLVSLNGASATHLYGVGNQIYDAAITIAAGQSRDTLLQGFTLHGAGTEVLWVENASPTLKNLEVNANNVEYGLGFSASAALLENVHIENASAYGLTAFNGSMGLTLENVLIEGNGLEGVRAGGVSELLLVNTVLHGNGTVGLHLFEAGATMINSIITSHTVAAVMKNEPVYSFTSTYNVYYGNGATFDGIGLAMGVGDDTQNPLFGNTWTNDFTLQASSPARNSGNPDSTYNDANGTRNDKGAYGGPLSMSW